MRVGHSFVSFYMVKQIKNLWQEWRTPLLVGAAGAMAVQVYLWTEKEETKNPVAPIQVQEKALPMLKQTPEEISFLWDASLPLLERVQKLKSLCRDTPTEPVMCHFTWALLDLNHQHRQSADFITLANEMMEQMRLHDRDRARFFRLMHQIMTDHKFDPLSRDYAAQHYANGIFDLLQASEIQPSQKEFVQAFCDASRSVVKESSADGSSVAGSLALGLVRLTQLSPDQPDLLALRRDLAGYLSDVTKGSVPCRDLNRIPLMKLAEVSLSAPDAVVMLLNVITSDSTSPAVRLAAISSFSRVASHQDFLTLKSTSILQNPIYQQAIAYAEKHLQN